MTTLSSETEQRRSLCLRPASREERWLIVRRILREKLDPTKLDWRKFVVAEDANGAILGFAQMKDWGQGVREFGSLVVEAESRGQGIGGKLLAHFLDEFPRPVYLFCGGHNVAYYLRFGFRRLKQEYEIPGPLQHKWRMAQFFSRLFKANVALMVIE
ncbi:MAG: GNAT family N-acetyltransferase [Caldilineaceae bacterium]|nr:GNAT family N-acetyltransferase [Caldilineaceae bacterium]